jgi:hypothetical protein
VTPAVLTEIGAERGRSVAVDPGIIADNSDLAAESRSRAAACQSPPVAVLTHLSAGR